MRVSAIAGQVADPGEAGERARPRHRLLHRACRIPSVPEQRVAFGTSGHRGSSLDKAFNEWHVLAITQAICALPGAAADRRPAVPRHGHARAVGAGLRERARGAGGQRRRGHARGQGRVHADPGGLARHPHLQPRAHDRAAPTASSSRPRTIRPTTAASSTTRRTAGRPIPCVTRWIEAKANALLEAGLRGVTRIAVREGASRRHDAPARLPHGLRERSRQRDRHGRDPRRGIIAWASIRSAAPASTTGARSPSATASISRSSATPSIRRSAS